MTGIARLELRGLRKHYGSVHALRGVDLAVEEGEFLTVLGPSGSGKTTILRLIAGFTLPSAGQVLLQGRDVSRMTPAERGIGMVFQHYALFPHMTVAENIAYGLKMRGWPREQRPAKIKEMQELVGLTGLGQRLPRELSGGQQQRVALARALAYEPALLLMDEPLGALDRELRIRMAAELRRIHRELRATVVYVTHDREEAMTLSDRVAIMQLGLLEALDTPHNLFSRPPTRFVAAFFGGHNVIPSKVRDGAGDGKVLVECLGQVFEASPGGALDRSGETWLAAPAAAIQVRANGGPEAVFSARVDETLYIGNAVQVTCLTADGRPVLANVPVADGLQLQVGQQIELHVDLTSCVVVSEAHARSAERSTAAAGAAVTEAARA